MVDRGTPYAHRTISSVELRITVTVEPTARHTGQPLTRAQVEHVVALRERIEQAVQAVLETPRYGRSERHREGPGRRRHSSPAM